MCLTEGRTLLISDVDLKALATDEKFNSLLRNRPAFIRANAPFKLMVRNMLQKIMSHNT